MHESNDFKAYYWNEPTTTKLNFIIPEETRRSILYGVYFLLLR